MENTSTTRGNVMRRLAAVACATAMLVVGCGPSENIPAGGTDRGVEDTDDLQRTETPGAADAGSDPEPYQCVQISTSPDGEYTVGDAGTAEVFREGDDLTIGEINPNEGWEHEVVEEGAVQVEIHFTHTEDEDQEDHALVVTLGDDVREEHGDVVAEICTRVR
jgi:hypothetical protein